jgi:hypothetical protein
MKKLTPNFDINSFVKGDAETRRRLIKGFTKDDLQKLCKRVNLKPEGNTVQLHEKLVFSNL